MKILRQAAISAAVCAVAELIRYLVPLPIPASVYGLIRPEQIETAPAFLIAILPLLFVAPTVALVARLERLASLVVPILLLGIAGTTLVIGLSGRAAQAVGRHEKHTEDRDA